MAPALSDRLRTIVDALPLRPGIRILEIGCGPGAMARAIAGRIGSGKILAIDRSERAIARATATAPAEIASGRLEFRHAAIETFALAPGEAPYDLAIAIRVGALDGRHPRAGELAKAAIKAALEPGGRLLIDAGQSLREAALL